MNAIIHLCLLLCILKAYARDLATLAHSEDHCQFKMMSVCSVKEGTQRALQHCFNAGLWLRRHRHKNNVFSTSLTDTVKTSEEDVVYTWSFGCSISDVKIIYFQRLILTVCSMFRSIP